MVISLKLWERWREKHSRLSPGPAWAWLLLPVLMSSACDRPKSEEPLPPLGGSQSIVQVEDLGPAPSMEQAQLAAVLSGADQRLEAGRTVPLVMRNLSSRPLLVKRAVRVELARAGTWTVLDPAAVGLFLRKDCRLDEERGVLNPPGFASSCIQIDPQASFVSQPWLATHGHAQCACDKCVPVASGRYRYVVRTCDGSRTIFGEPFILSAAQNQP